jgi:hypothetical protein
MAKTAVLLAALALVFGAMRPAAADPADHRQELSVQSRPHITIHPRYRRVGHNAKRQCRAWLAQEYRVSGPVIVPRQQCWWE